jgi:hypothetical protein
MYNSQINNMHKFSPETVQAFIFKAFFISALPLIERVQRRAAKYVTNSHNNRSSVNQMLEQVFVLPTYDQGLERPPSWGSNSADKRFT